MKRFALALVGVALAATFLHAQVNTVPQLGVVTAINTKRPTYAAVALSLPPAASTTDIACITGSSTKTIRITKITVSGTAATLVTVPITLVNRVSADTGGTAATTTANWANTIGKLDSNDAAATATLISYSANPTIVDTTPTYIRTGNVTLPVTSAGVTTVPLYWEFGLNLYTKHYNLRGAAQQACLNLNATSITTGLLQASIEWTED